MQRFLVLQIAQFTHSGELLANPLRVAGDIRDTAARKR